MELITDAVYIKQDYTNTPLPKAEYDNCNFTDCNFESASLTGIVFTDCSFQDCNISNANVKGTAFKEIIFTDCKLTGLSFSIADPFLFSVGFERCILQLASFYKLKMKGTKFISCNLNDADFAETDLTNAVFNDCSLAKAVFDNTILEKADFRTAINYSINPETNRIKKAKFSMPSVSGLLDKYNIIIE